MKRRLFLFAFVVLSISKSFSQEIWIQNTTTVNQKKGISSSIELNSLNLKKKYFLSKISNAPNRNDDITSSILIPLPSGKDKFEKFKVYKASNFSKALSRKFPSINSYIAKSVSSNKIARFSYSEHNGLIGFVSTNKGTIIIKPSNLTKNTYTTHYSTDSELKSNFDCKTIEIAKKSFENEQLKNVKANDGYLRKYKLAIATTGEYSNYFLSGTETSDLEKKEVVLAAINTSLTRINAIFERDFAVTMELVGNNDEIIFLNATSDPFSSGNFGLQLQYTLDNRIAPDNYDVGHLFAYENDIYGNAGCIACVCTDGEKGSAYTVHSQPNSDHFNMIAAHEFGHQFGGYHVQSSSICRSAVGLQEVEPGSGSTIMGYAGICPPNVQDNPDDYFNFVDIRDIIQWTRNDSSCAELITTGNNDPSVNAGNDYTIPKSTAFILEGSGNDFENNTSLSYCWEQNDPENPFSSETPKPTWLQGPLFRSKLPTDIPKRHMPQLDDVIAGNLTPTWEVVPSVNRTMNFVLTARDNAIIGAKTASDEMTVTVIDNAGPFLVTSQNSNTTWNAGENQTITWDVANTNQSPINTSTVTILLSTDGGYTYPYTVAQNIPNIGSASIVVPSISSSTNKARIMIKADNNIFYAINSTDINIQLSEFIMEFDTTSFEVCQPDDIIYEFNYKTFLGFNEITNFSVENLPNGLVASFTPSSSNTNNTAVTLTISGTENIIDLGNFNFNVVATSSSVEKRNNLSFRVYDDSLIPPVLNLPANNQNELPLNVSLEWNQDPNVKTYTLEVANDENFINKFINENSISATNYAINLPNYNTTYYWRLKSNNECGQSNYSSTYSFTTKCFTPTNINITNVTQNSSEISWIDNHSSNWEIEIIETGTTPSGIGISTNSTTYIADNLISNTEYDIYVKSICSDTNSSLWIGPVKFKTFPNYCNGDKFYDSGGLNNNYSDGENTITTIIPQTPSEIVEIQFTQFQTESGYDYLNIYDGNDINATLIGVFSGNDSPGTLISKMGQGLTFLFTSDGNINALGWEANVSCYTITCPQPTEFITTNITGNTVDLSWINGGNETQWEVEYGIKGFIQGNGTKVICDSNPYTLEGLNSLTEYEVYIKAICGTAPNDDDSFITGPLSFKTNCGITTTPYQYGVENQNTNSTIAQCWEGIPEAYQSSYFWEAEYSNYSETQTGPYSAYEGNIYFRTNPNYNASNGGIAELLMPQTDISTLSNPVLIFNSFMYGENIGSLHVDVYHNNEWTDDIFVINGEQQQSSKDLWNEYLIDLSDYSNTIQIRFRAIAGGNSLNEIDIDNIQIVEIPSCPNPTNLSYTDITASSVNLSWISNGTETKWTLEHGPQGFSVGSGTMIETNSNPFTLTGLTPNQETDIYLKASCGILPNNNDSEYIGPITFKTPCSIIDAPYIHDVENQNTGNPIIENCWSGLPAGQGNYFWSAHYENNYVTTSGPYEANSGNLYYGTNISYSQAGEVAELFTPFVNINTLDNPSLTFYSFLHGENVGSLSVDVYDGNNWIQDVFILNNQQQTSSKDLWNLHVVDLSNFSNVIQVRFRAISGQNGNNEIDIDDISFIEKPDCPKPYNISSDNITTNSVDLSWVSNGDETEWNIEYGPEDFTLGTGTQVIADSNFFTLNALTSNTNYDIYVSALCDSRISENTTPLKVTTVADFCSGDHFYDTGGVSGNYQNNEDYVKTIYPSSNYDRVTVFFNDFLLEGCCDYLYIYDGPNTNSELIGTYNGNDSPGLIVSTHSTGSLTFKFTSDSSATYSGWEATVECITDDCSVPNNIYTSDITSTTATVNWQAGNDEQKWEIEYGLSGFTIGSGIKTETNTNTYTIINLDFPVEYQYYIRSICETETASSNSLWSGPHTFNTVCETVDAPYYENFSSNTTPGCWREYGSENWRFNTFPDYAASSAGDHTPGGGTNFAWIDGSIPNGSNQRSKLVTMPINISQLTNPSVEFSLFSVNPDDNTYNTLEVNIIDLIGDTHNLLTLQGNTDNGWKTYTFDISNIPLVGDDIEIEFIITEDSVGSAYFNDILIDDLKIDNLNDVLSVNDELSISNTLTYFPNPVTNLLTIKNDSSITKFEVYNLIGQKIISSNTNENLIEIDMSRLQTGTYIIKVYSEGNNDFLKVVKK